MKEKKFKEVMGGAQQMADQAAGKEVEDIREVTYDDANFSGIRSR